MGWDVRQQLKEMLSRTLFKLSGEKRWVFTKVALDSN